MKYLLTLTVFITLASVSNAQTGGGTKQTGNQRRQQINKREKKRLQRGTGHYYGNKDTTPGSPMGTGGAGGDMSGSPAGSAIETDDQTSKAEIGREGTGTAVDSPANAVDGPANTSNSAGRKSTNKKTRGSRH